MSQNHSNIKNYMNVRSSPRKLSSISSSSSKTTKDNNNGGGSGEYQALKDTLNRVSSVPSSLSAHASSFVRDLGHASGLHTANADASPTIGSSDCGSTASGPIVIAISSSISDSKKLYASAHSSSAEVLGVPRTASNDLIELTTTGTASSLTSNPLVTGVSMVPFVNVGATASTRSSPMSPIVSPFQPGLNFHTHADHSLPPFAGSGANDGGTSTAYLPLRSDAPVPPTPTSYVRSGLSQSSLTPRSMGPLSPLATISTNAHSGSSQSFAGGTLTGVNSGSSYSIPHSPTASGVPSPPMTSMYLSSRGTIQYNQSGNRDSSLMAMNFASSFARSSSSNVPSSPSSIHSLAHAGSRHGNPYQFHDLTATVQNHAIANAVTAVNSGPTTLNHASSGGSSSTAGPIPEGVHVSTLFRTRTTTSSVSEQSSVAGTDSWRSNQSRDARTHSHKLVADSMSSALPDVLPISRRPNASASSSVFTTVGSQQGSPGRRHRGYGIALTNDLDSQAFNERNPLYLPRTVPEAEKSSFPEELLSRKPSFSDDKVLTCAVPPRKMGSKSLSDEHKSLNSVSMFPKVDKPDSHVKDLTLEVNSKLAQTSSLKRANMSTLEELPSIASVAVLEAALSSATASFYATKSLSNSNISNETLTQNLPVDAVTETTPATSKEAEEIHENKALSSGSKKAGPSMVGDTILSDSSVTTGAGGGSKSNSSTSSSSKIKASASTSSYTKSTQDVATLQLQPDSFASKKQEIFDTNPNRKLCSGATCMHITPSEAIRIYGDLLTASEKVEILEYQHIWYVGENARKVSTNSSLPNNGFDDERGDYRFVLGDHLDYRYEVIAQFGKGSFGQVVKAYDHKKKIVVALKVIRNKRRFAAQAQIEVRILERLMRRDTEAPIVRVFGYFSFRNHICISFEPLSVNLYDYLKLTHFKGFGITAIRWIAQQVLQVLRVLSKENIIHCDLKPENILIKSESRMTVRVIDFGSSCYTTECIYTYIQSRFYRAPEIILGSAYDCAIDMWSLGCTLPELLTGYPLFPGENEHEQLQCFMELLGLPPKSMLMQSSRTSVFFDSKLQPILQPNSRSRIRHPNTKALESILSSCPDAEFISFIRACLQWDPSVRITPAEALHHPFITNSSHHARTNRTQTSSKPSSIY